jgi:hypothetical protein
VYSYGARNRKPEITISAPREKVKGESCYDCGSHITNSVFFENGNVLYNVSWGSDRLTGSGDGGVEVIVNGESKAYMSCSGEPFIGNLEGIQFEQPEIEQSASQPSQ